MRYFLYPLVLLVNLSVHGQGTVQWMHQGGLSGQGRGMGIDPSANAYVVGTVGDPALFDQDTTPSHFADAFIAKYDDAGDIQWVRTGGDDLIDQANEIAVDANGNAYVTGFFRTNGPNPTVNFDGQVLAGLGSSDLFLAKYDANGVLLWIRYGGGTQAEEGRGVALTPSADIVVSGFFQDTVVFGTDTLVSEGLSDVLLLSYDSNGNFLWSHRAGGSGDDKANKLVALPNGDLAAVGDFQGSAAFGGDTLLSPGLSNIFLARFDASGNALWARRAGSTVAFTGDHAFDIDQDLNGDLIFCGEIAGTADFGGITLVPHGGVDLFIARYDGNGNALWAHHAGGPQIDHAYGVAVDDDGNSYLTGQADDGANTVFDTITLAPFGNEAVFLAKYDVSGAIQWVKRYAPGLGGAVEVLGGGCLYFTGGASGIVGQPAFDSIPWQYVDRAIFTARFCEDLSTGVDQLTSTRSEIQIYPNPATDRITILLPEHSGTVQLRLLDAQGRMVRSERAAGRIEWDLSECASGIYALVADTDAGPTTRRLVLR